MLIWTFCNILTLYRTQSGAGDSSGPGSNCCLNRKTLLDDEAEAKKLISSWSTWNTHTSLEMHAFHFEMHKNGWFPFKYVSILGIDDCRLSKQTCEMHAVQVKCPHLMLKCVHIERPLPGMLIICWTFYSLCLPLLYCLWQTCSLRLLQYVSLNRK